MAEHKNITAKDMELGDSSGDDRPSFNLREVREQAERTAIMRALNHAGGKLSQAADMLGVSRPTMYDFIKKFNLKT